jgi:hypothetical protein
MILKFQFNCWGHKHSEIKIYVILVITYIFVFFLYRSPVFQLFLHLYYMLGIYPQKLSSYVGQVKVGFFSPCT